MSSAMHDHARWGAPVWGADDEVGAGNLLTAERRLAALALVREGRVFDVSHEIAFGAPHFLPNQTPFLLSLWATWRDSMRRRRAMGARNEPGVNIERIEMTAHVGTHVDALGHVSKGNRLYNDIPAEDAVGDWGLTRLGIEKMPPVIARCVLLDVAGIDGDAHLRPGRLVTPDALARAAARAGTGIEPGDLAMIRTGWGKHFHDAARYIQGEPGIDVAAAQWLTRQGVVAIGADNMAVEVLPNPDHTLALPVHQHALVEAGVHLIENLALEEMAASGVRVGCMVMLAVKYRGATGSPVRPVVVV
jgi:kynurenine formamidase